MKVSRLSYNIAFELGNSGVRVKLEDFYKRARPDQYIWFSHNMVLHNWNPLNGHYVIPACIRCGETSEYNFAGYGTMFLKHNAVDQIKLPNGKFRKMEIYCKECIKPFSEFKIGAPQIKQLSLF